MSGFLPKMVLIILKPLYIYIEGERESEREREREREREKTNVLLVSGRPATKNGFGRSGRLHEQSCPNGMSKLGLGAEFRSTN